METAGKIKNDNMSNQDFYKFQFVEQIRNKQQQLGEPHDFTHGELLLLAAFRP